MAGRFSVEAVFKAVDRITAPISRMQNRVNKFTRSANRGINNLNKNMGKFVDVAKKGAAAATVALGLTSVAMADVINTGADFEQALVSAAAKFPGEIRKGTESFKALEEAAKRTGRETEFSATESANALNFLAMAGFNAENSIAALPGVVDLATASEIDLARASDIATDTLGAFGLMAEDSAQLAENLTRVNDVLAKTTTSSNTSMVQLFETLKKGGPVATAAGASIETAAALAGTMANAGIKAEIAGTAMANMFLNLSKPSKIASKMMRRLGIETKDASGNLLDVPDIIDNFNKATSKLSKTQKQATTEIIFGREGLAGTMAVLSKGGAALRRYRSDIEDAGGASKTMADVMRDTINGQLKTLTSTIESVKISTFELVKGPLSEAIEKTTEWIRANEKLIATNLGEFLANIINNFDRIVQIGKQIAGVVVAYIALTAAVKAASAAIAALKLASATLTATIGLLKAATIAYSTIVTGLPKALAAARIAMIALNAAFAANPVGLVIKAISIFVGLAATVITAWQPVTEFFEDLWGTINNVVGGIGSSLQEFGDFFGFTGDDNKQAATPQVVSPQERVARNISEQTTTNTSQVTIKDETGRAEVTSGSLGLGLQLESSGGF